MLKKSYKAIGIAAIMLVFGTVFYTQLPSSTLKIKNAYITGQLIKVKANRDGVVDRLYMRRGDILTEGDLIAAFEESDAMIELRKSEVEYESALQASLSNCVELKILAKEVEMDALSYETNQKRKNSREILLKSNIQSQDDFINFEFTAKKSALELQKSKLLHIQKSIGVENTASHANNVKVARLNLQKAVYNRYQHRVFAPGDAYVYDVLVHEGTRVNEGDLLAVLVPQHNVLIQANVLEDSIAKVSTGQKVDVKIDVSGQNELFRGIVQSIVPAAASVFSPMPINNTDSTWVKVRQRVPVLVEIEKNPDHNEQIFPIGASAEITINTQQKFDYPGPSRTKGPTVLRKPAWQRLFEERAEKILRRVESANMKVAQFTDCQLVER